MKYGVLVVLLIASAMAQDKLTVKQCRADLEKWVLMFKATYAAPELENGCSIQQAEQNRHRVCFESVTAESSQAEYHLWHGETIHPAGQASPWKSQLGKAASAPSSGCYRVRNASPTLGTHEANMYRFSGVTELVRAE
jgi:hypothetical protein